MYVPLRVHGHHSMLTGVDAPRTLLERARALGVRSLALCDVDTLTGTVDFLLAARAVGEVRPIVGAEISDPSGLPGRIVALVEDERGWKSLCKLVSARHLGADPGVVGARLAETPHEAAQQFRLAECAAEHQAGLIFVVDHPRLLMALAGRVAERSLFAAIHPAGLHGAQRRARDVDLPRNVALLRDGRDGSRAPRTAGLDAFGDIRSSDIRRGDVERSDVRRSDVRRSDVERSDVRRGDVRRGDVRRSDVRRSDEELLETPKVPAPEKPVSAQEMIEAARAVGIATLAVPDVYCAFPAGAVDHRARAAIKHNALLVDLPESFTARAPMHLMSPAEMRALYADLHEQSGPFAARADGALLRTIEVAERCTFTPKLGGILFPTIALGEGETAYSNLVSYAFAGAASRYRPLRPEVVRRLDYELTTIDSLGFAPYFLLVKQIADFARESGIPCVGRGSAADSLVAYCLRLTDADPLRYKLVFERFLNPTRRDRPDIDLDFCWRRRDEVLEHVYGLFGTERTAMIATLATCGVRAAFRESALVEGVPPAEVNRWSRKLPMYWHPGEEVRDGDDPHGDDSQGENAIAQTFRNTPEARDFPFDDPRLVRVMKSAARLVDAPRHYGLHPGGVVVAPGPITDFVSCHRAAKGVIMTQFDKNAVEAIGLVKMDLLGNRALTVVDDCVKSLAARGIEVDVEAIPEDDPRTAHTLGKGLTIGCFQVESPGMRNLLQQTGARNMDDVIQAVALIRPGAAGSGMKDAYVRRFRKLEAPTPPHPRLTEVLWDTHGVLLYQEDVMQVASTLAGMDLSEADSLRRALQKRRAHELPDLCTRFVAGCVEQGVARDEALHVWDLVANFASFAFCKAHAVTYGRISYRTVWLKTHHPAEFLAAFLQSDTGYYDPRVYVEEARRLGVPILGPDVNKSARSVRRQPPSSTPAPNGSVRSADSTAGVDDGGCLRIGLEQVKGIQQRTLDAIFAAREKDGPFVSLPDFLERTGAHTDECERLIQCGAFDAFDRTIPELLWRLHLLRAPERHVPRARDGDAALDQEVLAACRATPRKRDATRTAASDWTHRAQSQGWTGRGIGLGAARLQPGESAPLFPEREAQALALPRLADLDPLVRGRIEHELMGLTVRAHPTRLFPAPADARIAASGVHPIHPIECAELASYQGARVTLRGWPAATRHVRTHDGRTMRFLTLEDETGLAECVVFPDVYDRDGAHLGEFGTLCVTGTVENQMGACTLHVERIW